MSFAKKIIAKFASLLTYEDFNDWDRKKKATKERKRSVPKFHLCLFKTFGVQ